ncbi:glycosyltransferase family 4 protein [Microcoleus sp. ZQ-A2]
MIQNSKLRLLIVQYGGDYRESVQRFSEGKEETYYAQKYSVNVVAEIGEQIEEAGVLCCFTAEPYNEIVSNGVRAIGAGFKDKLDVKHLLEIIKEYNPTHLIVRTAIRQIFQWAIKNKVQTLAMFAESISPEGGLRTKWRNYWLSQYLNHPQIKWIGSYGIDASKALHKIGVKPEKIIPWNFIVTESPASFDTKNIPNHGKEWEMFYIGSMIESKGVGDILDALAYLINHDFPVRLKIVGQDKTDIFHHKAKELKIEEFVEFRGLVSNKCVVPLMREADLVLVPSRHDYPEGFPLAITHALCARTPIIASDHPMFINQLKSEVNAMIFPAGDSRALSTCVKKLLTEPELYHRLSDASYETWKRLQMPVKWGDMIQRWLDDSPENQQWLFRHRLSSGLYDSY